MTNRQVAQFMVVVGFVIMVSAFAFGLIPDPPHPNSWPLDDGGTIQGCVGLLIIAGATIWGELT